MRLADLVPEPHLSRLAAGELAAYPYDGVALPAAAGPLPPAAAFFYRYGACHYLAEALCQQLASRRLALVVHQGEPLHVYAVHGGHLYDAAGRQSLASARDLLLLGLGEWRERFLGEAGPRGPRFRPVVPDSPAVRQAAVNAARLVLARSLPDGKDMPAPTLAARATRAPILER